MHTYSVKTQLQLHVLYTNGMGTYFDSYCTQCTAHHYLVLHNTPYTSSQYSNHNTVTIIQYGWPTHITSHHITSWMEPKIRLLTQQFL